MVHCILVTVHTPTFDLGSASSDPLQRVAMDSISGF